MSISDLLFKDIKLTNQDILDRYPKRDNNLKVTRFAPSPTGYMHIGGLYVSLICKLFSGNNGIFYLRIEDTDSNRVVPNAVENILQTFKEYNIEFTENLDGIYKPYYQSQRKDIYDVYIKYLIDIGKAYPCFLTKDEINSIKIKQTELKEPTGVYGKWSVYRDYTKEQVKELIQLNKSYVIRFKSECVNFQPFKYQDVVKGEINVIPNFQDVVICKSDGLPTYHFAHVVDDYLMGTTHVIRGEEWLSSLPIHLSLFESLNWKIPQYVHIPTIMVKEGNSKRKLSKRKDPEAVVNYYIEQGYTKDSVIDYMMSIIDSKYLDWKKLNKPFTDYSFQLSSLNTSGALFDLSKLNYLSKESISRMSPDDIYNHTLIWSKRYNEKFNELCLENKDKFISFFNIDRTETKVRKDITKWSDVPEYVNYVLSNKNCLPNYEDLLTNKQDIIDFLKLYKYVDWSKVTNKDQWFEHVKVVSEKLKYSSNIKQYKIDPSNYNGTISDLINVLRVSLTGKSTTPDLYQIIQILGQDLVLKRINYYLERKCSVKL